MKRRKNIAGATLLEVVVGGVIVGMASMFFASSYRVYTNRFATLNARGIIGEIDETVRRNLFTMIQSYYLSAMVPAVACDTRQLNFAQRMMTTLPTGLVLAPFSADRYNPISVQLRGRDSASSLDAVYNRCRRAPDTDAQRYYFRGRAGIYFCALVTDPNGATLPYEPIVAEFFYTNRNVETGSEVLCTTLRSLIGAAPPVPTLGTLIYTLHWVPQPRTRMYSKTGMISRGNP